jgi:hypothetical protein
MTGIVAVIGSLALLALFVTAAVSVLRSQRLTGTGKLVWVLGLLFFPVLGPLAWFFIGRNGTPQLYRHAAV